MSFLFPVKILEATARGRDGYFSGLQSFRIMAWPTGSWALCSSRLVGW